MYNRLKSPTSVTPNEMAMWKTAAIIKEIQHETTVMSTPRTLLSLSNQFGRFFL